VYGMKKHVMSGDEQTPRSINLVMAICEMLYMRK